MHGHLDDLFSDHGILGVQSAPQTPWVPGPVTVIRRKAKPVVMTIAAFKTYVGRAECPRCLMPYLIAKGHQCRDGQPITLRPRTTHVTYYERGRGIEATFRTRPVPYKNSYVKTGRAPGRRKKEVLA